MKNMMTEIKNSIEGLEDKVKQISQREQKEKDVENEIKFKKIREPAIEKQHHNNELRKRRWRKCEKVNKLI